MATTAEDTPATRPFLKWAGGKFRLLDAIQARLPDGDRLIEPFAGAGAVFLNTDFSAYHLNDINPALINVYRQLKQRPRRLIAAAKAYFQPRFNQEKTYYALRQTFNQSTDPLERAALFVFLNRHGYNGLCRFNSQGEYNVPFGSYDRPYFPEPELTAFAKRLKHATLSCQDFRRVIDAAKPGDVVYCDPPYVPLSPTAAFTQYAPDGFGEAEQQALAEASIAAAKRGCPVLISNHDVPFTRELYQQATCVSLSVRRLISRDAENRRPVQEILALFLPSTT